MRAANIGPSSLVAASPRICRNSTGSTRFWVTSKPAWVALTMRSISPNMEPATSVRLFIGLTGASILRRFLCVYSSLWPPSGLVRYVGFAKLKNLSNQVYLSWDSIRNIMSTQQRLTITLPTDDNKTIHLRTTTQAETRQKQIYAALSLNPDPIGKYKTIVD